MIRGAVGAIRWGFYTAADVRGYSVELSDLAGVQVLTLTADVVVGTADAFKLKQHPLVFEAPWVIKKDGTDQRGVWRWPVVSFGMNPAGRLTARLGPMEDPGMPQIPEPKSLYV